MICCNIIADFDNNPQGNFTDLFKTLAKVGSVIITGHNFYFASDDIKINKKTIEKNLKKYGYKEFFIQVYTLENYPKDSSYIQGWCLDHLIRATKIDIELKNQEELKKLANNLQALDEELDHQLAVLEAEDETEASKISQEQEEK